LDIIGRVGFGFEFNATSTPDGDWVHTYNEVSDNLLEFPYIFLPILDTRFRFLFPRRMEKHAKLTVLNDLFNTVIKNKRENLKKLEAEVEDSEKDLLTLLIESGRGENDEHEPLTDEELRSELVLFFFAGYSHVYLHW
jgi:cytochrome P450